MNPLAIADLLLSSPTDGYAVNFDRLMTFVPKDVPSDYFKIAKVSVSANPSERPTFKQIVERIKYIQVRNWPFTVNIHRS